MRLANQRRAGALLGYANIFAKNLVNLFYVPLLLHFLGQGDFGIFQMTNSVVFMLTLLSAGFFGAYVRFYSQLEAHGDAGSIPRLNGMFILVYIFVVVLCFILGAVLLMNVDRWFSQGLTSAELTLTKDLMVIMIINVAVSLLSTPFNSYIVVFERFIFQQSRQLIVTLLTPFLAFLMLARGMGAVGVALAQLSVTIILLLLNMRYAFHRLKMRVSFRGLDVNLFKAILIFSFWILLNQIFDLVNNQVPNLLLGALVSSSTVAVFSIAVQIRNLFFSLSTTLSNVLVPQINRMVATKNDNTELTRLMTRVGRYQMILFCYIYGGFVVLGRYFVDVWAGHANANAYWLALAMTLPVAIPLSQNTGIEIQRAKNKHRARSIAYILTALLNIVISLVLIPTLSYWATAIGYIVSVVLGTGIFMNWYYQRRIGLDMKYYWRKVLPTVVIFILSTSCSIVGTLILPVTNFLLFILWGVVYSFMFMILLWFFALYSDEKSAIAEHFHRLRR